MSVLHVRFAEGGSTSVLAKVFHSVSTFRMPVVDTASMAPESAAHMPVMHYVDVVRCGTEILLCTPSILEMLVACVLGMQKNSTGASVTPPPPMPRPPRPMVTLGDTQAEHASSGTAEGGVLATPAPSASIEATGEHSVHHCPWFMHVVPVLLAGSDMGDNRVILMGRADTSVRDWKTCDSATPHAARVIVFQIAATLMILQKVHGFMHMDLNDGNVLLQTHAWGMAWERYDVLEYVLMLTNPDSTEGVLRFKVKSSGIRAMLADFGSAHLTVRAMSHPGNAGCAAEPQIVTAVRADMIASLMAMARRAPAGRAHEQEDPATDIPLPATSPGMGQAFTMPVTETATTQLRSIVQKFPMHDLQTWLRVFARGAHSCLQPTILQMSRVAHACECLEHFLQQAFSDWMCPYSAGMAVASGSPLPTFVMMEWSSTESV